MLQAADQDFLWEMLYIALWDPPEEPRRPRSVLDHPRIHRLVAEWGRQGDYGLAAETTGSDRPVGAIWIRLQPHPEDEGYGCPYPALGIAVRPEYQGMGVGSQLMERFLDGVRPQTDGVRLGVHPKNANARRLYEKVGFQEYALGAGDYPQMKLTFP